LAVHLLRRVDLAGRLPALHPCGMSGLQSGRSAENRQQRERNGALDVQPVVRQDATAIWEWGFLKRGSSGLYIMQFAGPDLYRPFLDTAERLCR
jgi:hypothetical protein